MRHALGAKALDVTQMLNVEAMTPAWADAGLQGGAGSCLRRENHGNGCQRKKGYRWCLEGSNVRFVIAMRTYRMSTVASVMLGRVGIMEIVARGILEALDGQRET